MEKFIIKSPTQLFMAGTGEWNTRKKAKEFKKYADATFFFGTTEHKNKFHRIEKIYV